MSAKTQSLFSGALNKMKSMADRARQDEDREATARAMRDKERQEELLKRSAKEARQEADRLATQLQEMTLAMKRMEEERVTHL
jgi:hypothetical protein